ncbi:SA1320 family protein [Streptococcus infantis]|uniref:SA1320 family protein n=1 Tax=Streptococcus infantis TaxID=68892 RepID=UPI0039C1825F
MNEIEKSNRRVEMSAVLSDAVYKYEIAYTAGGNDPIEMAVGVLRDAGIDKDSYEIVDKMYDPDSGVAAIAVYDKLTKETYISYAGTNMDADGHKDPIVDLAIALNDTLYLKEKNKPALDFYDRVEASGHYISTTTGHSYGEFQAGRTAMERQVPYNFGYQGAPQSVNGKTANEMVAAGDAAWYREVVDNSNNFEEFKANIILYIFKMSDYKVLIPILPNDKILKQYWDYLSHLKDTSPEVLKAAKEEAERIEALRKNYKGYSVTFSTTRDVLTNIAWAQDGKEISFGGQALDNSAAETLLDNNTWLVLKFLGITRETKYPGNVVAIDLPIHHNMKDYRKNAEAMEYTKQVVLEQLFAVDIDGDGLLDFAVTPENTTTKDLLKKYGDSKEIRLDTTSMMTLITNLNASLRHAEELLEVVKRTSQANENVMNNLSSRTNNLKEAVFQHLQSISLIEAIQKIDKAFSNYDGMKETFKTLNEYNPYDFSRNFDWFGFSGLNDYFDSNGNNFDHGAIASKLYSAKFNSDSALLDIEVHNMTSKGKSEGNVWAKSNTSTYLGVRGAELVNSFEGMIEKSTTGLDKRSHFGDGIPQAVNEILKVLEQNIQTIIYCISYTISVAEIIKTALEETDRGLARNIDTLDFSSVPDVNTSVSQDYNTYLEESGIFDDRDVISAFDDQIDVRAEDLANQMSTSFSSYLYSAKGYIQNTNKVINTSRDNLKDLINDFPTEIYYKNKFEDKDDKKFYGTVESEISISSTIRTAASEIDVLDIDFTTAATTINLVVSMLGGFKPAFRNGMEDAFYGAADLKGVVRAQKAVGAVVKSLQIRFTNFKSDLDSLASGAAVQALGYKLGDMTNLMGNVSHVIDDCFGDD